MNSRPWPEGARTRGHATYRLHLFAEYCTTWTDDDDDKAIKAAILRKDENQFLSVCPPVWKSLRFYIRFFFLYLSVNSPTKAIPITS